MILSFAWSSAIHIGVSHGSGSNHAPPAAWALLDCRLLNAWDYAARFVVSARYRFDEDSAIDEFSERGRLLLRHEQVHQLKMIQEAPGPYVQASQSDMNILVH